MFLDCQLKGLLKNYFKTVIVGFGKADGLGLSKGYQDSKRTYIHVSVDKY